MSQEINPSEYYNRVVITVTNPSQIATAIFPKTELLSIAQDDLPRDYDELFIGGLKNRPFWTPSYREYTVKFRALVKNGQFGNVTIEDLL